MVVFLGCWPGFHPHTSVSLFCVSEFPGLTGLRAAGPIPLIFWILHGFQMHCRDDTCRYLAPNPVKHLIQDLVTLKRSHKMDLRPHIAVLLGFEHLFFVAFSRLQNLKIIWKIFMSVSLYNFVACKLCIKSGNRVISYHLFVLYIVKCLKILSEWPSLPSLAFWGTETKIRLFSASYKKLITHPPI